jgi:glycosyltransferase involved in cell wall biosynthesis
MVVRAVQSALDQTLADIEVTVVVDGPNPATTAALEPLRLRDRRLRVLELATSCGAGAARNRGVAVSSSPWIALLDDDDDWLPHKLETQMRAVEDVDLESEVPIIASQLIALIGDGRKFIWPRYAPTTPLCEYFFNWKSWSYGDAVLQTSTVVAPKKLFQRLPYKETLGNWDDMDWMLRATALPHVTLMFVEEPLSHWRVWYSLDSVSAESDWWGTRNWIRSLGEIITPRAYAGILATTLAREARDQKQWLCFPSLFAEMIVRGRPRLFDCALYCASWVPRSVRLWIAVMLPLCIRSLSSHDHRESDVLGPVS